MAIFDALLPLLKTRFAESRFTFEAGQRPRVIIPAAHATVGDIILYDDGDEITAYVGQFTHSHFSNYENIATPEKERIISQDVIGFLEEMFADRIVMWGSHSGGGGCRSIDYVESVSQKAKEYVWSGPRNT